MPTKSPWLHLSDSNDPEWIDDNFSGYVWSKSPGALNSVFDVPKGVTEIRFILSKNIDEGFSYKVVNIQESPLEVCLEISSNKIYKWDCDFGMKRFIQLNNGVGKYLSLEYR